MCAFSRIIVFASVTEATLIVLPPTTRRSPTFTSVSAEPFADVTAADPAVTDQVPVNVDCQAFALAQVETLIEFPIAPGNFATQGPTFP